MGTLYYGSFEELLYREYESPESKNKETFTPILLMSGLGPSGAWTMRDLDKTVFARYRTGARKVKQDILNFYNHPDVRHLVIPYFDKHITKYIKEAKRDSLLNDFVSLIQYDSSIPYKQKAVLKEFAKTDSLNRFLSEVFIFAIHQDPPSKLETAFEKRIEYVLTPGISRANNYHIIGRDEFITNLCEELEAERVCLQLTGMGGVGKTAILYKAYSYFSTHLLEHNFDHIALLTYTGNMGANLLQQIAWPETADVDSVFEQLSILCDQASVLLFIDDVRPKSEDYPDASFYELLNSNVTVLLASRTLIDGFIARVVEPLSMGEYIQVFQTQRYIDVKRPPALPEKDALLLENIIENRAGCNALIVNRLGAMMRVYGWTIPKLDDRLKEKKFDIRKGYNDDEKLQEEINKLYAWENIEDPAEQSILEAFTMFYAAIDIMTCVDWLQEDAGIASEDDCRMALTKLAMHTWLISHYGEDAVSFSMHQLVRAAVKSQAEILRERHAHLIEVSWGLIDIEVQVLGTNIWTQSVKASVNDTIRYRIQFKNTGKIGVKNVIIRDILPPALIYTEGTTVVYNTSSPDGVHVSDKIITNRGINIGDYAPNGNAWIYFSASIDATCNVLHKIQRNIIEMNAGFVTKTSFADVSVIS